MFYIMGMGSVGSVLNIVGMGNAVSQSLAS